MSHPGGAFPSPHLPCSPRCPGHLSSVTSAAPLRGWEGAGRNPGMEQRLGCPCGAAAPQGCPVPAGPASLWPLSRCHRPWGGTRVTKHGCGCLWCNPPLFHSVLSPVETKRSQRHRKGDRQTHREPVCLSVCPSAGGRWPLPQRFPVIKLLQLPPGSHCKGNIKAPGAAEIHP